MKQFLKTLFAGLLLAANSQADTLTSSDIFALEYAAQIEATSQSNTVYFVRQFMDIQTDRKLGNIWSVDLQTNQLRPVTSGNHSDSEPKLSPDGSRLAYISNESGSSQIHMLWLDTGHSAKLTNLTAGPRNLSWSPNGKQLAFQMFVEGKPKAPVHLAGKPKGAKWAESAIFIDDLHYRFDGGGYGTPGSTEIFILPADGGSARQLTDDEFDNGGPFVWSPDGQSLFFAANRRDDSDFQPLNAEIYRLDIGSGETSELTTRNGPDHSPKLSPNGKLLAYLGYDDKYTNYENSQLYVMNLDGSNSRQVTSGLDRSIDSFEWAADGQSLFIQYDDKGDTLIAEQSLRNGNGRKVLTRKVGGQSYGRPYTSGEFDIGKNNQVVFTHSRADRPADLAVVHKGKTELLTDLNTDAFGHKTLAKVEEIRYQSSADNREIQGWIAYPPNFDPEQKYPLLLEIHGGPVTAYGPHFAMEIQLYAAAGYVVLYTNPRGSSSYGAEFAHTIDKNYPSQDYDDLMSGVDAVISKGFIDEQQLFITGGSGGGVLTAWAVSHTDRFAAAVVAKPVINWYSFVLTADFYPYFYRYWFGEKPWDDMETYMKYSPISYVGEVTTPTMLLTGEADYRTPMSETEQYYQALKLQGVETAMVRIPGASHGIYRRPSNLMSKVEYILWWFEQYRTKTDD
jgi:dipeptidyl aminopeptidase/acylaminoacyl peptidase